MLVSGSTSVGIYARGESTIIASRPRRWTLARHTYNIPFCEQLVCREPRIRRLLSVAASSFMRPLLPPLIILLVAGLFGMRFFRDLCAFSNNAKLLLRLMRSSDSEAGLEHLAEKSHYTLGSD
jgi:hypothetical protein